jgi:hypothetical protein
MESVVVDLLRSQHIAHKKFDDILRSEGESTKKIPCNEHGKIEALALTVSS